MPILGRTLIGMTRLSIEGPRYDGSFRSTDPAQLKTDPGVIWDVVLSGYVDPMKLHYTLDQGPARQISYYHPGLGTMEPAGALTTFSRKVTRLLVNLGRPRTIPPGSQIHHSSYKRAGGYAKRLPSDAIPVP